VIEERGRSETLGQVLGVYFDFTSTYLAGHVSRRKGRLIKLLLRRTYSVLCLLDKSTAMLPCLLNKMTGRLP
jgi:hypothetical protein